MECNLDREHYVLEPDELVMPLRRNIVASPIRYTNDRLPFPRNKRKDT